MNAVRQIVVMPFVDALRTTQHAIDQQCVVPPWMGGGDCPHTGIPVPTNPDENQPIVLPAPND